MTADASLPDIQAVSQITEPIRENSYAGSHGNPRRMGAVSTQLIEEARSIFEDLGYEVESVGEELRATRKWRVVRVTDADPAEAPEDGRLRCFVAQADRAERVRAKLCEATPEYDWAVVAVQDGDYDVLHPDAGTLSAP
jgi:hypothetical protein